MPPSASPQTDPSAVRERSFPGARRALGLLLLINLFNYIDRNVLAAVVPWIKDAFFDADGAVSGSPALTGMLQWSQRHLGFKPENALIGILGTAFMVIYTLGAPVFGRLAERHSRWTLVGIGVVLWSLASGASGLAGTFLVLLLTRCFVGIGEAAYGPVAPSIISDFYPVKVRGQVLAWFYMAIPVGSALGYVLGERVATSGIGHWGAGVLRRQCGKLALGLLPRRGPGILLGAWSFFMREPPRGQADLARAAAPAAVRWRDYALLLRTPSYVFCTLGMAAMTFAIGGIAFWMPFYLKGRPGTGNAPITTFGAIVVVAGIMAAHTSAASPATNCAGVFPARISLCRAGRCSSGFRSFSPCSRRRFLSDGCWFFSPVSAFSSTPAPPTRSWPMSPTLQCVPPDSRSTSSSFTRLAM